MDKIPSFYSHHSKIWSGPKRSSIYHPEYSIGQIINLQLKNWPKNIAQINDVDGSVLTSADIHKFSMRIAQHFKRMKLRSDDIIGIVAKNSTYLVAVANACFFNTSPLNPISPSLEPATLKYLFDLTKPKIIFCDGDVYEKVHEATKHLEPFIYTLVDHLEGVPKIEDLLEHTSSERLYTPEKLISGPDQTMAILCSSGTTGLPKAVCISNESLKTIPDGRCTSEDVLLATNALDWVSGFFNYLISMYLGITRVITNEPFESSRFVNLIEKYKVTWAVVGPHQISSLVSTPGLLPNQVQTIRILSCIGGSASHSTFKKAQTLFENAVINFGYGLTEFGGISSNFGLEHRGSVGKLGPGVKARIVDDNGENLGPNEIGEIVVQRACGWAGYYGNPNETQRMMDPNGWFYTADMGYFDDSHFLYVVDRKKDVLKYREVQYWSTEIEGIIREMSGVVDACVFGIYGEENVDEAGALVVLEKGSKLTENDVKNHVGKQLPELYKHLNAGVVFVERLPQSENGKILKRMAKELFIDLTSGSNEEYSDR